jgi:hypothetical protein
MFHLRRARCVLWLSFCSPILISSSDCLPQSHTPFASISGTVSDPSGARIPHAEVRIQSDHLVHELDTDGEGHFSLSLPLGVYQLSVVAKGFVACSKPLSLTSAAIPVHLELPLTIEVRSEEIAVPVDDAADTSGSANASALVFQGAQLDTFSDDDATFQKEIAALAGSAGQSAQFIVNGFTGGHFPPKQTIREVRINNNPYSAAYDRRGAGRAEILTQAGGDSLHGFMQLSGNGSPLNASNPYTGTEPPSSAYDLVGNLNGPIGKKTTYFTAIEQNWQNFNSIVNAYTLGANPQPISEAPASPIRTFGGETRLDHEFTKNHTLTAHYEFDGVALTNGGLTGLVLPEAAYNSGTTTQTLQLSDSQVLSPTSTEESRFQYIRTRLQQNTRNGAPTIVISGLTTGGGSPTQALNDNQDAFEFQQNYANLQGSHFLHFGARYRLLRDANLSTANYNGQFTFPSLAAYVAKTPTQFTLTTGQASASILTGDLGAYAEDEWHIRKNFTLDLGLRFESQSAIPDKVNPAPRFGFAWAIQRKGKPVLTVRGGGGIFYDRFAATDLLTSVRQNGVTQQTYIVANPTSYPNVPLVSSLTATLPTTYSVNPNLRTEIATIGGASLERTLGKRGRVSVVYYYIGGSHQWLSQNINAPQPGTGVRPLGTSQNVYQFTSNGNEKVNILSSTLNLQLSKRVSFFSFGTLTFNRANTAGSTSFASNSYNLAQDYGRAAVVQNQLFAGGTVKLPLHIDTDFYLNAQSGVPFNITTGTDLNGDGIYNDRPAYATHPTANSVLYSTRYGTLDANPQPGEAVIPINAGDSPGFYFLQLTARRRFAVGPRAAAPPAKPGDKTPPGRGTRPWEIGFRAEAANLLNHNNPAPPIGVLSSPDFSKSITLANPFGANPATNRTVTLRMSFVF